MLIKLVAAAAVFIQDVTAAAAVAQPVTMVFEDVCLIVQTPDNRHEWELTTVKPADLIGVYYNNIQKPEPNTSGAEVRVIQAAKHGKIIRVSDGIAEKAAASSLGGPAFSYLPQSGYLGPDDVTFLVSLDGKDYEIHSTFYVVWKMSDDDWYDADTPATRCARSAYRRIR